MFRLVESNQDRLVSADQLEATEAALIAKIDTGLAEVRTEIAEVKSALKQDIGSVRTELKSLEVRLMRLTLGSTGALGILVNALRLLQ